MKPLRVYKFSWTDEEDEFHRTSWKTGINPSVLAAQMTEKFGRTFSRNAVLGRAFRQGLMNSRPIAPPVKNKHSEWLPMHDALVTIEFGKGRKLTWIADVFFAKFAAQVTPYQIRRRLEELGKWRPLRNAPPKPATHALATPPQMINIVEEDPRTSVPVGSLKPGMCKWPTNDDATAACGAAVSTGAYCPHHAGIAYRQPPTAKRQATWNRRNQYD